MSADFDVVVVGAGATGGIAAKELTEKGMKVLLLEAGPSLDESLFHRPGLKRAVNSFDRIKAGIKGRFTQARASWFSPDKDFLFVNDFDNPYAYSKDYYLWVRGRQVGGRFLSWGRVAVRMSDYDFKAASRDGEGIDWPICYDDLVPYYDKVEEFLGLWGREDNIDNLPDGKFFKTAGLSSLEQQLSDTVQAKWPERKFTPWRYVRNEATPPDASGEKRVTSPIAAAQATGLLTLRPDAVVAKVNVDKTTGLANGVTFIDRVTKQSHSVTANNVMLCASTIESVRLLLNSANDDYPNGLANSSGTLGKYFMDQTQAMLFGTVPTHKGCELVDGKHPGDNHGGFLIPRFQNLVINDKPYKRGFNIQGMVGRIPVPDFLPMLFGMTAQGEMLPREENQIRLHKRKKDAWGIPVADISISMSDNERQLAQASVDAIQEIASEMGWQPEIVVSILGIHNKDNLMPTASWFERLMFRLSWKKSLAFGSAIHECGGARMGEDRSNSVLNKHNQCWDIPNLYVTDSSCFVTNATCGPTLTSMAITARACDHIASRTHA